MPTLYNGAEGNTDGSDIREFPEDPARSKTPGMCGIFVRENGEIPRLPVADGAAGRTGKA
jgi:hypothetical protein